MINRRYTRPSRAVENLQQLSLSNSSGIDCTRPHTDVRSVYASKNLVVNRDGSMSLRKPLILRTKFDANVVRVIPLPNDAYIAIGTFDNTEGFLLLDNSLQSTRFRIIWNDVYDNERVNEVPEDTPIPAQILSIRDCKSVDTAAGVVLSNCALSRTAQTFPGTRRDSIGDTYHPIFNTALYDNVEATSPRFVNVYYDSELYVWCVQIHIPVPTNYLTTEHGIEISRNALLDNPFAVRDSYEVAVPSVKNIRAYAYTAKEPEGVVLADRPVSLTYVDSAYAPSGEFSKTFTAYGTDSYDPDYVTRGFETPYSEHVFELARFGNVSLELQLTFPNMTYNLKKAHDSSTVTSHYAQFKDGAIGRIRAKLLDTGDNVVSKPDFKIEIPKQSWSLYYDHIDRTAVYLQYAGLTATVNLAYCELTRDSFNGTNLVVLQEFDATPSQRALFANTVSKNAMLNAFEFGSEMYIKFKGLAEHFCKMSYTYDTSEVPTDLRVADLTESVKNVRYRAADLVNFSKVNHLVLKAFVGIPTEQFDPVYCSWRYTLDGVTWQDALADANGVLVTEPSQEPITDVIASGPATNASFKFRRLLASKFSNENLVADRADCLILTRRSDEPNNTAWDAVAFKFKLVALNSDNTVKATYGEALFYDAVGAETLFEESDIGNAASGKQLYSKSRLYSYGVPTLKNNILYSYANEFDIPLTNAISLSASADTEVTALVRWRNALISATEHALYLSEQQGDAFYTKALNTAVGIPAHDGNCCVPVLNGVVFKSGSKVYQLYPNMYSDNETTLNVTDISQSVSHYLEQYSDVQGAFAFSTESEYVLMLPDTLCTRCLRYDYTTRVWTYHEYDVRLQAVRVNALDDIRLFGTTLGSESVCEFLFDTEMHTLTFSAAATPYVSDIPYGDVLYRDVSSQDGVYGTGIEATVAELEAQLQNPDLHKVSPIAFELDTGQKADAILTTKQFVESKIVFATLSPNDSFPMQLLIHIDGDPHYVTQDISTDAPFWENSSSGGALNTTFGGVSGSSDNFNILRQLVVRYSGKGKSIRHILTGESLYNFKLYETYTRYKLLNVKQ